MHNGSQTSVKSSPAENAIVTHHLFLSRSTSQSECSTIRRRHQTITLQLLQIIQYCPNRHEGKLGSGLNLNLFLYRCVQMVKRLHFLASICLPLKKKKMLPYISASHLVCIGGTVQLTPVCQWRFWRVTALRMQEKVAFFPSPLHSLCWYLPVNVQMAEGKLEEE